MNPNLVRPPPPGVANPQSQFRPAAPDPFDMMVNSAASFDTDSPVEVHAGFDPAIAPVGGRVIYRLTVTALDESLKPPDPLPVPKGLELTTGGRRQVYQPTVTGRLRPEVTLLYRTTVTSTGAFTMPPFEIMAYGKPVKVPPATLTVVPEGMVAPQEPPRLLVDLPEGEIFAGQTVKASLILPQTPENDIRGLMQPEVKGEFVFSEPMASGLRVENIARGGVSFRAFVQDLFFTPVRSGKQQIIAQAGGIIMPAAVGQGIMMSSGGMLIDSEPVILNVKPVPEEGRLPGFTGAVGKYQLDPPRLSTNRIRAGEPITLTMVLRGEGNLGRITPPPVPQMRDWEGFPPATVGGPQYRVTPQWGTVAFNYTLIPVSDRLTETPPIPFCYFDPVKKAYVDLTIPSVPLNVTPADPSGTPSAAVADATNDDGTPKEPEETLVPLVPAPGPAVAGLAPLQQTGWFFALQLAPALAIGGLWGWDRRRRHLEQHPEIVLKRRARRGLRRELRRLRRAAGARDIAGFVAGAANALREACAPHYPANPDALVCADILRELPATGLNGNSAQTVRRLFAADDALRFGGQLKDESGLLALQPHVEDVLEKLGERL